MERERERERCIEGGDSRSGSASSGGRGGGDAAGESSRCPSVQAVNPPVRSRTAGVECGEWGVDKESERRHKEEEKKDEGRGTETVCLKLTG